jgi:mycofactocin precursor
MVESTSPQGTIPAASTERDPAVSAPATVAEAADDALLVEADLLVEEVSIDGMCGVY